MSDEMLELESDLEIQVNQNQNLQELAFDAVEMRVEIDRQLAGLDAILKSTSDSVDKWGKWAEQAAIKGDSADETACKLRQQKCVELCHDVRQRMHTLSEARESMVNVLKIVKKGSDA